MALKTFVKVGSVNNLSDARYCAGMDVDLIGFSLESNNPDYVSPETYKELTEWLSGVDYVGEFESYTSEEIIETVASYPVGYLQIQDHQQLESLKQLKLPVILKVPLEELYALPHEINPDYLLLTGDQDELSPTQVEAIKKIAPKYNLLLATGITEENVEFLLNETGAKGIALQGGNELRPGYKDYDELADILETLELED